MVDVFTNAGSKIYIGTTAAATSLANYEADTYVEIQPVEDLGEIGDESAEVNFTAVGDRRVRKLKGSKNSGSQTLVVGRNTTVPGQIKLVAAEGTDFDYNFKIVLNDAPPGGEPSMQFFRAKVMSKRGNLGSVDNVQRRTFMLGINTEILEVDAEPAP